MSHRKKTSQSMYNKGFLLLAVVVGVGSVSQPTSGADGRWATTWATATEDIRSGFWMAEGYFPPKPLAHGTLRMFVRTSIGGESLRFRFSNAFGTSPVEINTAHFALVAHADSSARNGDIDSNTDTALKFRGLPRAVIPPGEEIYSDPVEFKLPALSIVAVSIHYGEIDDDPVTGHRGSRTTSFFAPDNSVSAANMEGAAKKDVWYTLSGIEVFAPESSMTVVAIGDSITDGNGTNYNFHTRWTDYLATRLGNHALTAGVGVANMGIGGSGTRMAQERFRRDVLEQSGARWVILFIGVNDIIYGKAPASFITEAYADMAHQAHEKNLTVYGATITPMGDAASAAKESVRQQVNTWIRTTAIDTGTFDACIDFDDVVRGEGKNSAALKAEFKNDDLHLNSTGYQALADSIDLNLFITPAK